MIAPMAGTNSRPRSVSAYSTDGGEVGITRRVITPFFFNSRSLALSTLAEIGGMSDAQLAEAARAGAQVPDHIRRPGAAQQRHAFRQRACGGSGDPVLAQLQGHDDSDYQMET